MAIKVLPNAARDAVVGWSGEELRVRVHAPPLDGRANACLCELLAEVLVLPKRAVSLVQGEKSQHKVLRIRGLATEEVKARLAQAIASGEA